MFTLTKHGKHQLDSALFQAAFDAKNIERLLIEVEDIGEGVGHDTVETMIEACKAMAQRIGVAADTARSKIGLNLFGSDSAAEWLLSPAYRGAVASEAKAVAAAGGV